MNVLFMEPMIMGKNHMSVLDVYVIMKKSVFVSFFLLASLLSSVVFLTFIDFKIIKNL